MRKKLDRVTLVIADTVNYAQSVYSLQKSLEQIEPARTIFFTDMDIKIPLDGVEIIKIPTLRSKADYSHFIVKELWKHIETEFVLVTQWDGFVLNGDSWSDDFYKFDYIGAPWLYIDGRNMGNGGFSLRTQRLQAILGNDKFIDNFHPEDDVIGRLYRNYLTNKYQVRFADDNTGDRFSFELRAPVYDTFGFHGHHHQPYKPTIVISRKGALGDIIALEPLLHYYYTHGYKVCLNTLDENFEYYQGHYFKVHHPKELDQIEQYKEINLDLAYEIYPKQLHLKSYYDICGITDGEIRNPKMVLDGGPVDRFKMFDKYVVIHIDERPQASRNIEGIDWETVAAYIKEWGYNVIQIGRGSHYLIREAIFMHAPNAGILTSVIGNANLFIGVDSGPSNLAVACGTKSIIFSGSVDLRYIIPDMSNVIWIHNHDKKVCEKPFCWHESVTTTGQECYINRTSEKDFLPPCSKFSISELLDKIKEVL